MLTLHSSSWPPPVTSDLGSCSWPFLCRRSLAFLDAAPDLGCGVAPLGRSCTVAAWHSRPLPLTSWGNSSWPPPFGHGVLPACAPDLGRGVAPLTRT